MSTPHIHAGPRLIGPLLRIPASEITRELFGRIVARYPDLRPAHQPVFQHIDHPPRGTRLTDLADRAGLTKQGLIEVVDDLVALGYIERIPDPADRRAKLIRMTGRGEALHQYAMDCGLEIESRLAARLGQDDFATLKALLTRLGALFDADLDHGGKRGDAVR